jgi:Zn-dependent protease
MFLTTLFTDPIFFLRVVVIVILSVTLHELAHGVAAMSQGDRTPQQEGHLTLNPVTHMGWHAIIFLCITGIAWGQMPINSDRFRRQRLGRFLVSAAGPLMNLMLAGLAIALLKFWFHPGGNGFLSFEFFYLAARINLILFFFNLVPMPPLDGFNIASEISPSLRPAQDSPFALFGLMLLLLIPSFGKSLNAIADFIVQSSSGISLLALQ